MRLLDRQVRLLDYLTSSDAIFGDEEFAIPSFGAAFEGENTGRIAQAKAIALVAITLPIVCRAARFYGKGDQRQ